MSINETGHPNTYKLGDTGCVENQKNGLTRRHVPELHRTISMPARIQLTTKIEINLTVIIIYYYLSYQSYQRYTNQR